MNCFITGTDTGVGKTAVTCGLLTALRTNGKRVAGMKPVAAGIDAAGFNEDVTALHACSIPGLAASTVSPYIFKAPTAPHIAARLENRVVEWMPLAIAYHALAAAVEVVLVEGVGGWQVPLSEDLMQAELPRRWSLPVILVAGIRLGALNHTLLTVAAIKQDRCTLLGWIANVIDPVYPYAEDTITALTARIDAPCLARIPWSGAPTQEFMASQLTAVAIALEDRRHPLNDGDH